MSIPVISLKVQNKTLGARKKTKAAKFCLSQPFSNYKPEITYAETEELKTILKNIKVSKESKKCAQKVPSEEIAKKKWVSFGFNSVISCMKTSRAESVLISSEFKSYFITSKIIILGIANNLNIKILCVPNLSEICKSIFGIPSCFTLCLLNQLDEDNPYNGLHNWICQTFQKYPIPYLILERFRRTKNNNNSLKADKQKTQLTDIEMIDFNQLYLKRSNENQRQFIPADTVFVKTGSVKLESLDFISLNEKGKIKQNNSSRIEKTFMSFENLLLPGQKLNKKKRKIDGGNKKKKKSANYVQLTVNKIQGNPNKIKKKKKKN